MTIAEFTVKTAELGGDAFVITVAGEADLHTVPELDRALHGVIALGGTAAALDLDEVTFIDSTALGVLLRHQTRLQSPRRRARDRDPRTAGCSGRSRSRDSTASS